MPVHLWLGLTLGVVGAFLGLSGSLLVYDRELDGFLHPARYATTGTDVRLTFGKYADGATRELGERARLTGLRLPDGEDGPLVAFARAGPGPLQRVFIDPPSGRVLDIATGFDLVGWTRQFHESLQLRDYSGREIVGAIGVAMLISTLSGIYLWWPARRLNRSVFGFRHGFTTSRNLHYTLGFYGSIMLAMLSFTGIYLAYPEAGRGSVAAFAALSPSPRNVQAPESSGQLATVDAAVAVARGLYPTATVTGVGFPMGPRGAYRINLREVGDAGARPATIVFVDSRTRAVLQHSGLATRTRGDTFLAAQRTLHEGHWLGAIGRLLTFMAGLLPATLVTTGAMIWLFTRRLRRSARISAAATQGADD